MSVVDPVVTALSAPGQAGASLYLEGPFNLSLWGAFSGEVVLQRSFDAGTTWLAVAAFAAPIEALGLEPEGARYRLAAGAGFTGSAQGRLGR